jgi:hypothetical protein
MSGARDRGRALRSFQGSGVIPQPAQSGWWAIPVTSGLAGALSLFVRWGSDRQPTTLLLGARTAMTEAGCCTPLAGLGCRG